MTLHSFEKVAVSSEQIERFATAGIDWRPHRFQSLGSAGGALRVAHAAVLLHGADLVHARSDLAAASTLLARCPHWVWDVRSFWIDQRVAMGLVQAGSTEERVMRLIEGRAAARSGAIVTLTAAAIPVLQQRHGGAVAEKVRVVPTCVDLSRFTVSPMPDRKPLRVLMSGSFNPLYDLEMSVRLVRCLRERRKVDLTVLSPNPSIRDTLFGSVGATFESVPFSAMPEQVAGHHVGFGICKPEAGVELLAAAPTKLAEFLACGRPVVVNAGLGDMQGLVEANDCGVVVMGSSDIELVRVAGEIERLVDDPEVSERCRLVAKRHFDVDVAVEKLLELYRRAATA
ncbi:MAG: hypothetical protein ACR2G7_06335 [Acidimicrobiales bacterium]